MSNNHPVSIIIAGADARVVTESDQIRLTCSQDGCEANCCTKSAPIVLNPYEIDLICRESRMSYDDLLDVVDTDRAKGFPLVMLPRDPACCFFSGKGCRIYPARPLACRLYPLGRVFDHGKSHLVLPELNVCSGLNSFSGRTVGDYLHDQATAIHVEMADRWIEFVSAIEQMPLPDKPVAFHMLVYSPDAPPAPGGIDPGASPEERFLLRLTTAQEKLPRFLRIS
jgi:hypothetical protein